MPPLLQHFETVALDIWETLRDSLAYDVSQGEETITDNLLLYLIRQDLSELKVIKTPKHLEPMMGTDWEWWIGNPAQGFKRYALQAKKLDPETHRYMKLKHKVAVGGVEELQHEVLERYAEHNDAIPLYVLYNFIELDDYKPYWQCHEPLDHVQLGATVTSLENIKNAISKRGERSFERIHLQPGSLPLRCLPGCPGPSSCKNTAPRSPVEFDEGARIYRVEEVPFLSGNVNEIEQFPSHLYSPDARSFPKRILVVIVSANPSIERTSPG